MSPGTRKKITIDEIAKEAFVSRSVVSRVLNDRPNVSPEARLRVLEAIKRFDYRPDSKARGLATHRTKEICTIIPRRTDGVLATGYWPLVLLGIAERSAHRGYFQTMSAISNPSEAEFMARIVSESRFDGFVLVRREVTRLVAAAIVERDVPAVLIGHDPEFDSLSSVDVDNRKGARAATEHLVDLGHMKIGLILGPDQLLETTDRKAGYLEVLESRNIPIRDELIARGDYTSASGYHVFKEWVESGHRPTAVFCTSDVMAFGVLRATYELGLSVPGDIAVVGFDDLPAASYSVPPLTTVHQPIYDKGAAAADMLIDEIEERNPTILHARLRPDLVVRASCGGTPSLEE